jgi:hypothetical protein
MAAPQRTRRDPWRHALEAVGTVFDAALAYPDRQETLAMI